MDNQTIGGIAMLSFRGLGVTGIASTAIIEHRSNRRGKKISPVLDKQYGPKIKENLNALEDAVRRDDIPAARIKVQERAELLDEIRKLSNSYVSASWTGACFAADEVKKYIAAGSALENYVNAR